MLWLITACQAPSASPGAEATMLPATATAIGGSAGNSTGNHATAAAVSPQATQTANRPERALLEQHALDVGVYQPGDPGACGLPEPAAPADLKTTVRVFFGCTPTTGPILAAVPARQVSVPSGADAQHAALRALLAGPTGEEQSKGYLSNFGAQSQDVAFDLAVLDDGHVVVDFDPAIRKVEFIFVSNMDATQIVATLGQFPEVKRVTILVGGQLLCQIVEEC